MLIAKYSKLSYNDHQYSWFGCKEIKTAQQSILRLERISQNQTIQIAKNNDLFLNPESDKNMYIFLSLSGFKKIIVKNICKKILADQTAPWGNQPNYKIPF